MLSPAATDQFLSIKNGASIAHLLGFDLPLKVNMQNLVRYHSACPSFTGSRKSNLTSQLVREAMNAEPDLRVVIFDISMEYSFLLQDVFADKSINSKIITEIPVTDADHFRKIIVTPRKFEKTDVTPTLQTIWKLGRLGHYVEDSEHPPTYEDMLEDRHDRAVDTAVQVNPLAKNPVRLVCQWPRLDSSAS